MNPRAAHHDNTISNRARYDHFDTSPYIINGCSFGERTLKYYTTFFQKCKCLLKKFLNYAKREDNSLPYNLLIIPINCRGKKAEKSEERERREKEQMLRI